MAKLFTLFLVLIAIQAAILIYGGGDNAESNPQQNTLWSFVTRMDLWESSNLITVFGTIALALVAGGITSGSYFTQKLDFPIMAAVVGGLLSIGAVFSQLADIFRSELMARVFTACTGTSWTACPSANFIVAMVIGPLAFYYAWTVVEWWRAKDM